MFLSSPFGEIPMMKSAAMTISFEMGDEVSTQTFVGYSLSNLSGEKKMSWNYRVVYVPEDKDDIFGENSFSIREVFYAEDGSIEFWSEEPSAPNGTDFEELCNDFDLMAEAFERPILILSENEDGEPALYEIEEEEVEEDEDDAEEE